MQPWPRPSSPVGVSIAVPTLCRPAQRCLHVFEIASRCGRSPLSRRCFGAALRPYPLGGASHALAHLRSLGGAVRGLALTSLADSAAHRGVAPAIEARASRMLGAPIRIGAIEARSSGWVPALELRDVRVLDAEQRVALTLPRVFAALSPRSLLALEPRFAQLLIDGAEPRRPARQERPHPRRRPRLRRPPPAPRTTTSPPTGSSSSTSS